MNYIFRPISLFSIAYLIGSNFLAAEESTLVNCSKGVVVFEAGANVAFINIHGEAKKIKGSGKVTELGNTLVFKDLNFEIVASDFSTGMKKRDKHLYERIFTSEDSMLPNLKLTADEFTCTLDQQANEYVGTLNAKVTMRSVENQLRFDVRISSEDKGYLVAAQSKVALTQYEIGNISYMGVVLNDLVDVKVNDLLLVKQ